MITKQYAESFPSAAGVYQQIPSTESLESISDIAKRHGFKNLYEITESEIKKRRDYMMALKGAPDDITLYRIIQKDAPTLPALEDLFTCALEHHLLLFALSVFDSMLYFEKGKNSAKNLFKEAYEKAPETITDFNMTLIVNLFGPFGHGPYDPSAVEGKALQEFFADKTL